MADLDDLFNDLLDDDLLRQAAEEEERLKASNPTDQPPPPKKMKPALLFKPSTVTKAQNRPALATSSVVVSSAAPTINREYLAQFVPHLATTAPPPPAQQQQRARPEIPQLPPIPSASSSSSSTKSTSAAAAQYKLFVGNLAADAREDALIKVFKDYASVSNIQVVLDKDKAKYGFVTFQDPFEMLDALREKNGKLCFNRPMQISKAKPESDPSKQYKSMARKLQ